MLVTPKISVVMAVYNGEKFLSAAIDSILNQTFNDFEFIIVDDGSKDESAGILAKYAQRDSRIKIISQPNQGLTRSLITALSLAQGDYIARMDADDESCPDRLEKLFSFMESNSTVAAVGSNAIMIDEVGRELKKVILPAVDTIKKRLTVRNLFIHGSLLMRRSACVAVGGYDITFRLAQDYDLLLRLLAHGYELSIVPDFLYRLRSTSGSLSVKRVFKQAYFTTLAQHYYFTHYPGKIVKPIMFKFRRLFCLIYIYKLGIPALLRLLKIIR